MILAGIVRGVMTIDWTMGTSGGRYLVCALPLLAVVARGQFSALFGEGRGGEIALVGLALVLLATNVFTIWATAAGYGTL